MNSTGVPPTTSEERVPGGWLLWVCLAAAWFCTASLYPFFDPDEGRYAEIPREMAASGDWLTPRLADLKYFEKPPLQYWATAALYKIFGVNEWTARAWPLALSFLCLPLVFYWARRHYGSAAAAGAVAALGASPFFLLVGHINVLDGAFTFFLTATVFAFVSAQAAPRGSSAERNAMVLSWLSAALAVLSKGIVVPVLAGLTLFIYSLVQRDFSNWRRLHVAAGLPVFLAISAPWFIAVSTQNPEFPQFFFLHEHFARFLTKVHRRVEPFWYFLPFLMLALLPWLGDVRRAFTDAWRAPREGREFHALRFLLVYAGVVLVFFSISQSKLPPYVLPLVPPLAMVVGIHLARHPSGLRRGAWLGAAFVALTAVGLVVYSLRRYDSVALPLALWGAAAIGVSTMAAFNLRDRQSSVRNGVVLAAGSMLAWQCLIVAFGSPPSAKSARGLVEKVRPHVREGTVLYSVGEYRQSVPPYLQRVPKLVAYEGELEFGLRQEPERNNLSLDEFAAQWETGGDAIAFIEPKIWTALSRAGAPGRIIASDRYSTVVSRQ